MKVFNYLLIAIYLISFAAEFVVNDRADRVAKSENLLAMAVFMSALVLLLSVSVKNIKTVIGKVGITVIILTIVIRSIFEYL
jgi:hypothetical protein